ncbi:MAG: hypothetical protein VKJ04_05385 [Vampirovibrionales bacterium]|nr:hypothetical protein [Vampirovibrionales bacterium]
MLSPISSSATPFRGNEHRQSRSLSVRFGAARFGLATPTAIGDTPSEKLDAQRMQYYETLHRLMKHPVHVAQTFPFQIHGYDTLSLAAQDSGLSQLIPSSDSGNTQSDQASNLARKQLAGFVKLSADSTRDIARDTAKGGLFGLFVGGIVTLLRLPLALESIHGSQRLLGWFVLVGYPLLGATIGSLFGAGISSKHHFTRLRDLAKSSMIFG